MKTTAKDAFNFALQNTNINSGGYEKAHAIFPYVVIRDTLVRLGIRSPRAEMMAAGCSGTARQRFERLKPELTQMGF